MPLCLTAPYSVFAVRFSHANAFPKGAPLARHFTSPRTSTAIL